MSPSFTTPTTEKLSSASEYILRVSAGSSPDSLKLVPVNCESLPIFINNEFFTGYLCIRMRKFSGVSLGMEEEEAITTNGSPSNDGDLNGNARNKDGRDRNSVAEDTTKHSQNIPQIRGDGARHSPKYRTESNYFKGRNRLYSIMVQGRFKETFNGDDIIFGADSDRALTPIPGVGIAIRICKWLDPALEADVSGDNPHIYSPLVSAMNSMSIYPVSAPADLDMTAGKVIDEGAGSDGNQEDPDEPNDIDSARIVYPIQTGDSLGSILKDADKTNALLKERLTSDTGTARNSPPLDVREWAFARSNVPEDSKLLFNDEDEHVNNTIHTYEKRKKFFGSLQGRQAVTFSPDKIYAFDFYDAYFSLSSLTVKLPGFSINCFKYWDGRQPLRYSCKQRNGAALFFCVQFDLVPRSEYPGLIN